MKYTDADSLLVGIANATVDNDVVAIERRGTIIGYYIPVTRPEQTAADALSPEQIDSVLANDELPATTGLTFADPLWRIVGIGHSAGPTDIAANKHKYLAEAYSARSQ